MMEEREGFPSAADLDAHALEEKARRATAQLIAPDYTICTVEQSGEVRTLTEDELWGGKLR
jgi:hypothetical protein